MISLNISGISADCTKALKGKILINLGTISIH